MANQIEEIWVEYSEGLQKFIRSRVSDSAAQKDILQEVFLKVWRNRKQLKPDLSFKAYLFKIAYHHILELFEQIYFGPTDLFWRAGGIGTSKDDHPHVFRTVTLSQSGQ